MASPTGKRSFKMKTPDMISPGRQVLMGVVWQRRAIVRQNNAVVFGCPCQKLRVTGTRQPNVLYPDKIEVRLPQQQSAHDVAVEVLIGE